jgi:hypothetical protein
MHCNVEVRRFLCLSAETLVKAGAKLLVFMALVVASHTCTEEIWEAGQ